MRVAFYGSSLLSAYWNGAATYYRGIIKNIASRGYAVTFYEPDAFDRQAHRDIDPPAWCRVVVYEATEQAVRKVITEAAQADIVIKASGVGVFDDVLLEGVMASARPGALRLFWDVDAPATLGQLQQGGMPALENMLPHLDGVLTYGGGAPVIGRYRQMGARYCRPIYNALDPDTHHPVPADPGFAADLNFLANRLPDREARVEAFFIEAALRLPQRAFLLGGNGWADKALPENVRTLGHVGTNEHNAFNTSSLAVLNVARDSMAEIGFSPATRVFEAAGAGACLITDAWEGIEQFLAPDREILVARDGKDVAAHLERLSASRAREIGLAARSRILAEHTYAHRGVEVDQVLRELHAHAGCAAP